MLNPEDLAFLDWQSCSLAREPKKAHTHIDSEGNDWHQLVSSFYSGSTAVVLRSTRYFQIVLLLALAISRWRTSLIKATDIIYPKCFDVSFQIADSKELR